MANLNIDWYEVAMAPWHFVGLELQMAADAWAKGGLEALIFTPLMLICAAFLAFALTIPVMVLLYYLIIKPLRKLSDRLEMERRAKDPVLIKQAADAQVRHKRVMAACDAVMRDPGFGRVRDPEGYAVYQARNSALKHASEEAANRRMASVQEIIDRRDEAERAKKPVLAWSEYLAQSPFYRQAQYNKIGRVLDKLDKLGD